MMNEQIEVLKCNMESRLKVFFGNLEKFAARWYQLRPSTDLLHSGDRRQCLEAVQVIRSRKEEFGEMEETLNGLVQDCKHFDISPPNCSLAEELRNNFVELETMWSVYEKFALELEELSKEDWISFRSRTYVFEEFLSRWFDQLRNEKPTSITALLMKEIDQYKELVPALKWVRGEALSTDHWIELFRLVGLPRTMLLENLTFGDILSVAPAVMAQADNLKNLIQRAQAEVLVREALQELDVWGAGAVFSLTPYVDSRKQRVPLITDWKNVVTQVGDNQALLASLQGSPYFGSFADRANAWGQRLADLDACLLGIQAVQRRWVYLEPIFGSGALTREAGRFNRVDLEFRSLLASIEQDNRVVSLVNGRRGNELRDKLTTMQDQLSRCQRALNDFLEEKRNLFPRFYFLGDDDLLEILGQSSNPNVIQAHLRKLFQAVHNVIIESPDSGSTQKKPDNQADSVTITEICSSDGERVPLKHPILVANESEKWLSSLESEMRATLSLLLSECLNDRVNPSIYPGQILALREAIQFSIKAEKAITTGCN
uniref:Cytoplasmic dynein 2 heavy chain 1 n=1 Tax=Schistocephalus solidus TaxID=70667 RepID=A0A0X3Q6P6_SCHSO